MYNLAAIKIVFILFGIIIAGIFLGLIFLDRQISRLKKEVDKHVATYADTI